MVGVDVDEAEVMQAEITDPPAAAVVTEVEEEAEAEAEAAEAGTVVLSTAAEDTPVEEEDGGKSNNRCWSC